MILQKIIGLLCVSLALWTTTFSDFELTTFIMFVALGVALLTSKTKVFN